MPDLIRFQRAEQLKQFLYGELPEDEAHAIEELLFADSEIFEELTSLENDLIDSYVLGKLEGADLAAFQHSLDKSEARREKVKNARALQRYFKERKKAVRLTVPETQSGSIWSHLQTIFPVQGWAAQFAIALVILVLGAGAAGLFFYNYRLRHELARMQTLRSEQEAAMQDTRRELEKLQLRVKEQDDQFASQVAQRPEQTSKVVYTATIELKDTAGGAAPAVIHKGKDSVTLKLPLEIERDYETYKIIDEHDREITSSIPGSGKKYLVVVLPVKSVTFRIAGINRGRAPRIIGGEYHLNIGRR